ncbi:hypothetical protein ACA910_009055 [Epithemia clementina (nom. ined.)]
MTTTTNEQAEASEEHETNCNYDATSFAAEADEPPTTNQSATTTTTTADDDDDVQEIAAKLYQGAILAPMIRASTTPLRILALKYGAHAVYTEELMDRSITNTIRMENTAMGTIDYVRDTSQASAKTLRRLEREGRPPLLFRTDPQLERGKLIGQIGTGEPDLALQAALHIVRDVDSLDLNMGCPKKFSVSGGMGSALLSDPDRACTILRQWNNHFSTTTMSVVGQKKKPISAKIRLLSSTHAQPTMDLITALVERGGIHALAIHGRTVGHDSVVPANWTMLEQVVQLTKQKYPQLPVLINGDFYTRDEFTEFQQRTGANGVLLGRPALYNTSIFRPPPAATSTTTTTAAGAAPTGGTIQYGYNSPLLLDKTTVIQDYLREAVRYDIHYKNTKYVISEMMNNRRAPTPRVLSLPQVFSRGQQTIAKVCACQSLTELCRVWNLDDLIVPKLGSPSRTTAATTTIWNEQQQQEPERAQAPAGEHKYDDAFLLEKMGPDAATTNGGSDTKALPLSSTPPASAATEVYASMPPNKRTRVG